jgi:hypothetical protein
MTLFRQIPPMQAVRTEEARVGSSLPAQLKPPRPVLSCPDAPLDGHRITRFQVCRDGRGGLFLPCNSATPGVAVTCAQLSFFPMHYYHCLEAQSSYLGIPTVILQ